MTRTRQWQLAAHPNGRPLLDSDFNLVETDLPPLAEGQVLLRTLWLGFDPARKGWMENVADYVAPMALGDVMRGSGVCEVVESRNPRWAVGNIVMGSTGWSEMLIHDGLGLERADPSLPPTAMLSVLGTIGLTAYCGLFKLGEPKPGDTVVVSGAAGATGSTVGQLAKLAGARAIGIAGGADKCRWLVEEAGYDAAIDYKNEDVRARLRSWRRRHRRGVRQCRRQILNDMLGQIATGRALGDLWRDQPL